MLVTTKNSVYSVVGKGDKIHITKVAALNPLDSTNYYKVGQTVITTEVHIYIGGNMKFYDDITLVVTSTVRHIEG